MTRAFGRRGALRRRAGASPLLSGTTLGNVTDAFSYDTLGEMMTYAASYDGTSWFSEQVTRDDVGRILTRTETSFGSTTSYAYGYDGAGRLTTVTRDGSPPASYGYDGNGNRTRRTTTAGTLSGTYDDQDRLLTYGDATYSYTPNGELASKIDAMGTTMYGYDAFGDLKSVRLPDGTAIEYVIDSEGRRIGTKVDGTLVKGWLYGDRLRVVAETDGSGAVVSRFIYGTRSNVPDSMVKGGVTYRIISDHLGSPRYAIDTATGTIAWNNAYDEFGAPVPGTPDFLPFGFAGGLYDADTGLVHFGAREYDAQTGRWTAKDPLGFAGGTSNFYAYGGGDPINLVDVDGLTVYPANFVGPLQPGDRYQTPADDAAAWALSHVGDTSYTYMSPHPESRGRIASRIGGRKAFKCNAFVWDALNGGGAAPGRMPGGNIPSASDWGSTSTPIPAYHVVPPGAALQRGDVIGDGVHVGIYYPLGKDPQTISAPPTGGVVENNWGFRPGQNPTVHRCDCAGH